MKEHFAKKNPSLKPVYKRNSLVRLVAVSGYCLMQAIKINDYVLLE